MPEFSFEAIGTHWKIDIYESLSAERQKEILDAILERIRAFDMLYSRFRNDSWITKLSREAGTYDLPEDAEPMFSLYKDLYELTEGLMTPLIGQTLVDAGYDANYSLKQQKDLVRPPEWNEIIEYASPKITVKKPALLDVGAIGKGYIIDIIGKLLEERGIASYCVDAGGDILHRSAKQEFLRIGLEDPRDEKKVIGAAMISNRAIAGSAGNRRRWGKFNHIINPRTLASPEDILAVWTVADSAMLADAMSTALYFAPAEKLLARYDFDYLIMHADASVEGSLVSSSVVELY